MKITYNKNENISEIRTRLEIDSSDIIIIAPEFSIIKNDKKYGGLVKDTTLKFSQKLELKNWIISTVKIIKVKNNYWSCYERYGDWFYYRLQF